MLGEVKWYSKFMNAFAIVKIGLLGAMAAGLIIFTLFSFELIQGNWGIILVGLALILAGFLAGRFYELNPIAASAAVATWLIIYVAIVQISEHSRLPLVFWSNLIFTYGACLIGGGIVKLSRK